LDANRFDSQVTRMTYALLEGLRVLELGQFLSAPYCGKLLADMGAEVTKIEPPGAGDHARQYGPFLGDDPHRERSGLFLYLNANKRGVTLDLGTPTGQGILRELVSRSDVLVHNLHPLEMDRLHLDYEAVSRANPSLVMASITPFGVTGPWRNYTAYDINLAAAGGVCEGLGEAVREPLTFGTPQVGYFAGLAAASAIVMALLAVTPVPSPSGRGVAEGRGEGQHIDIAEVETLAGIYNGPEALMAVYQWRMTRRTGHHALDFPYPNCLLRCKDGYIFVGAPEGRQWGKLLELMGNPEWSKEPRFRNRTDMNNLYADEVDGYMEAWLMDHTKAELLELALEHRVPLAPVRGFDEVRHDESLAGLFVDIDRTDTGPLPYPGPPYVLSDAAEDAPSPAPFLGQHNQEIYCDVLGFSGEQLVKLYQTGII
jgi:crotonobetainyl-CoA:carnitine CoA-transferase CaiB-like acyl-CoA transferase